MVTFYQRLDYKSRKKPLVSQIIIYFFPPITIKTKINVSDSNQKKKVLKALLPSLPSYIQGKITRSPDDLHSSFFRNCLRCAFNSIQKMLSLTSVRFIDLLPLFFMASDYHPTGLLQYIKLRDKSDYRSSHAISDLACRV